MDVLAGQISAQSVSSDAYLICNALLSGLCEKLTRVEFRLQIAVL